MDHAEAHELIGAYALDAVPPPEAEELSLHLRDCPRCQEELAGYRLVTSALGEPAVAAPAGIWDGIAARLHGAPGPPYRLPGPQRRWAAGRARRALAVVAVAAAAVVSLLAWDVSHLNGRVGHLQAVIAKSGLAEAADAAALDPHGRRVVLAARNGHLKANVVIMPGGQAYILSASLPVLPAGRTYQLWGLARSHPVSLGLLGAGGVPSAFRVDNNVKALMITSEPAGGSPGPTSAVLVQAQL